VQINGFIQLAPAFVVDHFIFVGRQDDSVAFDAEPKGIMNPQGDLHQTQGERQAQDHQQKIPGEVAADRLNQKVG
jgi:hypothetical protein